MAYVRNNSNSEDYIKTPSNDESFDSLGAVRVVTEESNPWEEDEYGNRKGATLEEVSVVATRSNNEPTLLNVHAAISAADVNTDSSLAQKFDSIPVKRDEGLRNGMISIKNMTEEQKQEVILRTKDDKMLSLKPDGTVTTPKAYGPGLGPDGLWHLKPFDWNPSDGSGLTFMDSEGSKRLMPATDLSKLKVQDQDAFLEQAARNFESENEGLRIDFAGNVYSEYGNGESIGFLARDNQTGDLVISQQPIASDRADEVLGEFDITRNFDANPLRGNVSEGVEAVPGWSRELVEGYGGKISNPDANKLLVELNKEGYVLGEDGLIHMNKQKAFDVRWDSDRDDRVGRYEKLYNVDGYPLNQQELLSEENKNLPGSELLSKIRTSPPYDDRTISTPGVNFASVAGVIGPLLGLVIGMNPTQQTGVVGPNRLLLHSDKKKKRF